MDASNIALIKLRNVRMAGGDETPRFEAKMYLKDRTVATVSNGGTGGRSMFHWEAPFTRQWAEEKLLPVAVKLASRRHPEFGSLFQKAPWEALDLLVMDALSPAPENLTSVSTTGFKPGDMVLFGRTNGEKTKGRVLKVRQKSIQVEQVEARGKHAVGTKWRVHPSFVESV